MSKVTVLLVAVLLAFAGWGGWWWFGATAQKTAMEGWLAERRADGWVAEAEVSVTGFPNRFDMTAAALELADPSAGWAWSAPAFRTYMLSWQPHRVIAQWPGVHAIAVPGARLEVEAEALRASVAFAPGTRLALQRAIVEAGGLELRSDQGWTAGVAAGQASLRQSDAERGRDHAYDVVVDLSGLRPPEGLGALFAQAAGSAMAGGLPAAVETVRLDATAVLAAPLDRRTLEASDIRVQAIRLRPSALVWGPMRLEAEGRLDVDAAGVPTGRIALRAENWRAMLQAGVEVGAIDPGMADAIRAGLGLLALFSSDREALEAPLRFEGGMVFLGPVPLGEAPRF